ncbi:MAG TPA: hypothetical protein VFU14_20265 [Acidimicrobiales bacterium]|nr:hypothetical protein [Acidimicrobiales bacterium]
MIPVGEPIFDEVEWDWPDTPAEFGAPCGLAWLGLVFVAGAAAAVVVAGVAVVARVVFG